MRRHRRRVESPRRYEIPLTAVGCELGSKRFKSQDIESGRWRTSLPPVRTWRLNLTGLSQVHNLYFLAVKDVVHVYIPNYPQQGLGGSPSCIIPVARSGANRPGFLDRECPHSINNLLVTFLGHQEILLMCCDDGDVVAYYTSHIQASVDRRTDSDGSEPAPVQDEDIRAFLVSNVQASAWGLAVHSQARKIAVAANTRRVTVFAYALSSEDNITSSEYLDDEDYEANAFDGDEHIAEQADSKSALAPDPAPRDRTRDHRFTLNGQLDNLPTVAFCNTGDDPEGRWLVCGDIRGNIYTWDLLHTRATEFTRAEFCRGQWSPTDARRCYCIQFQRGYPHSLWGLCWVSTRSFSPLPIHEMLKAFRGQNRATVMGDAERGKPYDASHQRSAVPNSSPVFVTDTNEEHRSPMSQSDRTNTDTLVMSDTDSESEEDEDDSFVSDTNESGEHASLTGLWYSGQSVTSSLLVEGGYEDPSTDPPTRSSSHRIPIPQFRRDNRLPSAQTTANTHAYPPCPFLSFSLQDIFIAQPRTPQHNNPHPLLGLHSPFEQTITRTNPGHPLQRETIDDLEDMDRLSLTVTIPELGLIVVATPKGRAAILALQQSSRHTTSRTDLQQEETLAFDEIARGRDTMYYFRMECLLPTEDQEKAGQRVMAPLIGIAAGPVQGTLGVPIDGMRRKWRLLLTYLDGTVLSYELGASSTSDAMGGGNDSLML